MDSESGSEPSVKSGNGCLHDRIKSVIPWSAKRPWSYQHADMLERCAVGVPQPLDEGLHGARESLWRDVLGVVVRSYKMR